MERIVKRTFETSFDSVWTDGGDDRVGGYFDGARDLNHILRRLFAGCDDRPENIPFAVDLTGDIVYGTKVRITVKLEVLDEPRR